MGGGGGGGRTKKKKPNTIFNTKSTHFLTLMVENPLIVWSTFSKIVECGSCHMSNTF